MMHAGAWLIWLGTGAAAVASTRNPLYLILLLGVFTVVFETCERVRREGAVFHPLRFAGFAVSVGALFNGLTTHFGETVLFRLPESLPLVGGAVTGEALVYGATQGLTLSALFAAFSVLSVAVPVRDLIGFVPRAFHPVAVVSAIAVTFVPATRRQFRQVQEAQAVRGHRVQGVRDWLPLLMPVLIGGLERAFQLAEAMTARGFAHEGTESRRGGWSEAALGLGLLALFAGGVLRLLPGWHAVSTGALGIGVLMILLAVWLAGRGVSRTRYRRRAWRARDFSVVGFAVLGLAALFAAGGSSRGYVPYPRLDWPPFQTLVGLGLLGFLAPLPTGGADDDSRPASLSDE